MRESRRLLLMYLYTIARPDPFDGTAPKWRLGCPPAALDD